MSAGVRVVVLVPETLHAALDVDQIQRTAPEHLMRDVGVAALRVPRFWNVSHRRPVLRLF